MGRTPPLTLLLDLLLQESLHGVLGGHVQRKLSFAVDRPDVGAVLDQVPARTASQKRENPGESALG